MTFDTIRLIHIALSAFWLSSIIKELFAPVDLTGPRDARRQYLVHREKIAGMLGTVSGMGTIISGFILLWMIGFSGNPWPLNAGMAVAFLMAGIGAFGTGGTYHHIIKALEAEADDVVLNNLAARLRRFNLLMLVLWLAAFFLMGLRHMI